MNDEDNKKEDPIVSTKKTWKTISTIPTENIDIEKIKGKAFKDRVSYLAIRGWLINIEIRNSQKYIYAVKYFNRKKRRIYLGNSEDGQDILKIRSSNPPAEVDLTQLIAINFKERIYYLAIRGWRIEIENHDNEEFIYAIKYIKKKKEHIPLGKKAERPDIEDIA